MRSNKAIYSVLFLSTVSLFFVFILQYEYNVMPCKICIWQRWPHIINILLVLIISSFSLVSIFLYLIGIFNMFFAFLLASYHFGLEQNLWNNAFSCEGIINLAEKSTEELLQNLNNTPISNCETVNWDFLNISLTGWNIFLTLFISIIWCFETYYRHNHETNSASQ